MREATRGPDPFEGLPLPDSAVLIAGPMAGTPLADLGPGGAKLVLEMIAQVSAREAIAPVEDEGFGALCMQGLAPRYTPTPASIRRAARALGADNDCIYKALLNLSDEDDTACKKQGVL